MTPLFVLTQPCYEGNIVPPTEVRNGPIYDELNQNMHAHFSHSLFLFTVLVVFFVVDGNCPNADMSSCSQFIFQTLTGQYLTKNPITDVVLNYLTLNDH